jgi:hypothetical protein
MILQLGSSLCRAHARNLIVQQSSKDSQFLGIFRFKGFDRGGTYEVKNSA